MAANPPLRAAYRLQLNGSFTFDDARAIVPYLSDLGISHLYLSPCLKSRAGSTHGYDIVDHGRLAPELGGAEAFSALVDALHARGMGLILDFVPNHMGIGSGENAWWQDVLENGQSSPYASYFDIDWHPIRENLRGKVLLPVLGDHYGKVLEAGELKLAFDPEKGIFSLAYYDQRLPLDPETYPLLLSHGIERLTALAQAEGHAAIEWHELITEFEDLGKMRTAPAERSRSAAACKRRLAALYGQSACAGKLLDQTLALFNGVVGEPDSFDPLHRLLEAQSYKLAYWRVASDEINYRRFFDINDLICLRQQNPEVFCASHRLILGLAADGSLDGLRIDHIDGLWNPQAYCQHLKDELGKTSAGESPSPAFPIWVEKILAAYEHLRAGWPVYGTTGYEFANLVNGLFVDPASERELTHCYQSFTGQRQSFDEVFYDRKRQVIKTQMSSQLTSLVNQLVAVAESERTTRDYTLNGLREALTEIVVYFPVYRTYIAADEAEDEDRRFIDWAVAQAKKRSPAADIDIFDFIRDVLTQNADVQDADYGGRIRQFVMSFQQYTAPVMAKGLEDTAFYVYNRLVSLNDVGGDPRRFGTSVAAFHHANQQRLRLWPQNLITLATHDSKRSADVRARINVITERAEAWRQRLSRWRRLNRNKAQRLDGQPAPSRNAEYLLYQTLLGTWPLENEESDLAVFARRVEDYLLKAIKEAKLHTSWINPNRAYEEAVSDFVRALFDAGKGEAFRDDFLDFQHQLLRFGLYNSLSQTLLLLTSPGVPDLYQGSELWCFTLVDPDNRRPVNFSKHRALLSTLQSRSRKVSPPALLQDLLANLEDGRAKLFLIWKTLTLRKSHPDLFESGDYQALEVVGEHAEHICAFLRSDGTRAAVVVSVRWFARLGDQDPESHTIKWAATRIAIPAAFAASVFTEQFSQCRFRTKLIEDTHFLLLSEVLKHFPVALLTASATSRKRLTPPHEN